MKTTDKLKIDKAVLEESVVTATTKNNDLYEMLLPFIEEDADLICDNVLGDVGMAALEADEKLLKQTQKVVCRKAFSENISSLDLVLTATGFGIVSTQDTAPASQARVEALRTQVERQWLQSFGILVDMLCKVESWGETAQAEANIRTVFYSIGMLQTYGSVPKLTGEAWRQAQASINAADTELRKLVSDEEMDALLSAIRKNTLNDVQKNVVISMRLFIGWFISGGTTYDPHGMRHTMDMMINLMEKHPDDFPEYMQSDVYKARHFTDYENTKESPLFIFGG